MPQDGEIQLEKVKARYSIQDVYLVDKNKVDQANEYRLYFEVLWGLGLAFFGSLLSSFNWRVCLATAVLGLAGLFFLIRYVLKKAETNRLEAGLEHAATRKKQP